MNRQFFLAGLFVVSSLLACLLTLVGQEPLQEEQPVVEQPSVGEQQQTPEEQPPSEKQSPTGKQQQAAEEQPPSEKQLPVEEQQQATGEQPPAGGQLPPEEQLPGEPNIYFLDREKGEPDELILKLTESIQFEEAAARRAEMATKLGWLYLLYRSDSRTALRWFSQAIELDSKNTVALEGALLCDMLLGNHDGLAKRTCDIIEAAPDSHTAELYLRVLHNALYITDSWDAWPPSKRIAFLEGLLARNLQNPINRSLIISYLMSLKQGQRQHAEAFQLWKSLGHVDKWFVLGMFCPEGAYGFYEQLPPERELGRIDLHRKFTVDDVELRWTPVTITRGLTYAPLMRVIKNEGACLFLATYINSPSERPAAIRVTTGLAFKLWLNGVLLHVSNTFEEFLPLYKQIGTTFKEGLNLLVIKLCGNDEEISAADLTLTITDPAGKPFEDVTFHNEFEEGPPEITPSGKELDPVVLNRTAKEIFIEAWKSPARTYSDSLGATYLLSVDDEEELAFQYEKECFDFHKSCAMVNFFMAFAYRVNPFLPAEQAVNQYRSALEKAVELDPLLLPAFVHLGDIYKEKDPDRAISYYRKALALNATYVDAVKGLADVFAERNWEAEWLQLINGLLEARPQCVEALSLLFEYYYDRMNFEKALELGERIDRLTEQPYHWHRARVMARRGLFEESIAEWERQIKEDPDDPHAYIGLAELFADVGRTQEAIAMYEKAIAADPHRCYHLHRQIGNLYARLNDFDKAEAHWSRILSLPMRDIRMGKGKQYDHREAAFIARRKTGKEVSFADRYRVEAEDIIKNAPDVAEYPRAPLITLFLQYIVEFTGDDLKHAVHKVHFITKILSKRGGERYGRLPRGQAIEECRVFLPDGRILEADGVQERENIALPELDRGTIIELRRTFSTNIPFDLNACARNIFISPFFRFEQEPLLRAQLIIITPAGARRLIAARDAHTTLDGFFLRSHRITVDPIVEEVEDRRVYIFNFENMNDYISEPFMPPLQEILPHVRLFQWPFDVERLMRIRRSERMDRRVTRNVKAKALELTAGAPTIMEKVKRIYAFVVSEIEDGGDNNPSQTLIEKRGPSLDLFIAMLRGIGIEAEYAYVMPAVVGTEEQRDWDWQGPPFVAELAAVNMESESQKTKVENAAGGRQNAELVTEEPDRQLERAVVPSSVSSVAPESERRDDDSGFFPVQSGGWLFLAVSQFSPFGAIPAVAEGGRAMIIRKDGVSIVPLPARSPDAIKETYRLDVTLTPDGKAMCKADLALATFDSAAMRIRIEQLMGKEQRKKMFQSVASWLFPGIRLDSFAVSPFDPAENRLRLKFEGTTDKFVSATKFGWQFRAALAPLELAKKLVAQKTREFPLRIRTAVTIPGAYEMHVRAPEGYELVTPEDTVLMNQFGYYTLSFRRPGDTKTASAQAVSPADRTEIADSVLIERRFLLNDQDIPPADFEKFVAFLKSIDHAERRFVEVRKK